MKYLFDLLLIFTQSSVMGNARYPAKQGLYPQS